MFCKNCGSELKDDALFCNNCGTSISGNNAVNQSVDNNREDNEVRIEIKPSFIWGYQIIKKLFETIIGTFFLTLWISDDITARGFVVLALFIGIIVLIVNFIRLFITKAQYKKTSYRFLKTKVEYEDSFLNKEEKQVKYEHIREVVKAQNVFERIFNVGRIILYTNASSGMYNNRNHSQTGRNGIFIHCVKNLDENYKIVKECIDAIEQ